jgi:uncharacterized protein
VFTNGSMTWSPRAAAAIAAYAVLYAGSLAWLARVPGFEAGESLATLLVFGLGFSLVAWLATRGFTLTPRPVREPARESVAVALYLAAFALLVLGWGFTWVREAVPDGRAEDLAMLALKLATMVLLPGLLFVQLGYRWSDLLGEPRFGARHWRVLLVIGALLLALQLLVGRGPATIAALPHPHWQVAMAAPFALAWLTLEAGLTEEFLFRALLQSRLAAWLRSPTAGLVGMAVLFGLAHAPGYVLRGAHAAEGIAATPDALTAAAYAIAVVSPIGFLFGVLWLRTRSLWLVVLLHGWTDLVPNLAPFVRTWIGESV